LSGMAIRPTSQRPQFDHAQREGWIWIDAPVAFSGSG